MEGARRANVPPTLACQTYPCPFCLLGLQHDVSKEQVLSWWRSRSDTFVLHTHVPETETWNFLAEINAVKYIMSLMQRDEALAASSAAATAVQPSAAVTYVACSFVNGAQSFPSGSQDQAAGAPLPDELRVRQTAPDPLGWYYKSGKQGRGDKEIYIEEGLAQRLEEVCPC